jgi:Flp pilus assembly protein TadG
MTEHARRTRTSTEGFALVHVAVTMAAMLLFTGVAVDGGRAYVVKAQLTKAVDGAALSAARSLNSGNPRAEAVRIFNANFPPGYMGTVEGPDPTTAPDFYSLSTDAQTGVNTVTIRASAVLPTTFMKLGTLEEVNIGSMGEATRRMVDLSLVLDVSSSIGSRWPAVRDAARSFVDAFDQNADRMALVTYGNGALVREEMRASRGFDKATLKADIPNGLPGGSTAMVEGLYRGWDELRTVPSGQQSGLRVIVLFTDGASNSVPGIYPVSPGTAKGLRTYDFPKNFPDPDGQTWNNPTIQGMYDTESGASSPSHSLTVAHWNNTTTLMQVPFLPLTSTHTHKRSFGIPTTFPLESPDLTVNGVPQDVIRGLRSWNAAAGRYPAEVFNINNAARNLVEIIADRARDDDGDYEIRIYTIGMGELVRYNLGTIPEQPETILMRLANDKRSPDYNADQLEGKYYFAATGADVGPAFQALQNQIIRLTK